ncbi:GapA-binding peptide SR1P [Paenibacillus sp. 481]|uniref:GapA-binding peptide SR1P n=1 Tax=Paenibacillus sp. 481 TaxID=2835869 RepID=UPI001E5A5F2B|nr:GapA-binding peptide SR1P [Paenibacillus sp. 481]UHA74541.1 GapA-binding peptide SR1P [Paenibacillus sp. 481]
MEHIQRKQLLGVILCKRCNQIIGEQDTDRFMVYYMDSRACECTEHYHYDQHGVESEVQAIES